MAQGIPLGHPYSSQFHNSQFIFRTPLQKTSNKFAFVIQMHYLCRQKYYMSVALRCDVAISTFTVYSFCLGNMTTQPSSPLRSPSPVDRQPLHFCFLCQDSYSNPFRHYIMFEKRQWSLLPLLASIGKDVNLLTKFQSFIP